MDRPTRFTAAFPSARSSPRPQSMKRRRLRATDHRHRRRSEERSSPLNQCTRRIPVHQVVGRTGRRGDIRTRHTFRCRTSSFDTADHHQFLRALAYLDEPSLLEVAHALPQHRSERLALGVCASRCKGLSRSRCWPRALVMVLDLRCMPAYAVNAWKARGRTSSELSANTSSRTAVALLLWRTTGIPSSVSAPPLRGAARAWDAGHDGRAVLLPLMGRVVFRGTRYAQA